MNAVQHRHAPLEKAAAQPAAVLAARGAAADAAAGGEAGAVAPVQRYRRRRRLRQTIYGDLVEAIDTATGRRVVAKRSHLGLVRQGLSAHGERVGEDPLTEGRVLQHLPRHPNVVGRVAEHVERMPSGAGDRHWLVLEHVGGGELFDTVAATEGAGLAPGLAHRYFVGLARAVQHLHRHRVAHLDISLENALLDSAANEAVLCDFGLAAAVPEGAGALRFTHRPGKLSYMAPEVFAGGAAFDPMAADVWSLGVTLFTMVSGAPPFELATARDRRYQLVASGAIEQLVAHWGKAAAFPRELCDLLRAMLCPDPARRATIDQVLGSAWARGQCPAPAA